ncbi:hypothetical protein [Novosphingobium lindaniclasticum]|uniref:N-acetyltransferase domain-containing protein n=1 Tax=Novosphingobium lindaniclasticum LE124 TaxID=1096930 RepID=T0IFG0_9SPHN|nr:hypothetical protein [Novosphingobium lindaniclasticum]EQB10420.1 hypothetical protein L284_17160 [Novosphingobium lindaniclasticum LE124]
MIQFHDLRSVDPDVVGAWADYLSQNLRTCDLDEIEAMGAVSPDDALRTSVELSSHAWVILGRDGLPVAMFGAAPHPLPGVGVVWMLGTEGITREAYGIARATRRYFDELNAAYNILWNYIDDRNAASMRWLRWGGFRLIGERQFGPHQFHIFARTNLHV